MAWLIKILGRWLSQKLHGLDEFVHSRPQSVIERAVAMAKREGKVQKLIAEAGLGYQEAEGRISALRSLAKKMLAEKSWKGCEPITPPAAGPQVKPLPPKKVEAPRMVSGSVVCHVDPGGQHMGILLREDAPGLWSMLFFTSDHRWAKVCRAATTDEIALAGLKTTKKTYLAAVQRDVDGLINTRLTIPGHRVQSLLTEFFEG